MDLQLFADAVSGKKIIYLYRVLENAAADDAAAMAFTTENETSISKDADATVTKDGTVRTPVRQRRYPLRQNETGDAAGQEDGSLGSQPCRACSEPVK